ncbi:MAG: FtsK/SpoIIIE domain-containing protein [Firmicutes bacterium]|nr:FtsK/SpoIIIE domain-containing protein [Bacillota bacterium]
MARKNYNGRKNTPRAAEREIIGWILSILTAFLLLCAVVPIILGPISGSIFAFLLGAVGFFVYPILVSLLTLGIFFIQGRRLGVPKLYAACAVICALMLVFILHLATTYSLLSRSFGEYASAVFNAPGEGGIFTAGGVVFGTPVYGIQAAISPVFAFVVFGLIFALAALAMLNKKFGFIKRTAKTEKKEFTKSGDRPAAVRPATDYNLFVEKIAPRDPKPYAAQTTTFSQIRDGAGQAAADYSVPQADGESKAKISAREELFGDRDKKLFTMAPYPFGPEIPQKAVSEPHIKTSAQAAPAAEPAVAAKPPKFVHITDYGLSEPPPHIPEKDLSLKIVPGEIVNGEALSARLSQTPAAANTGIFTASASDYAAPPIQPAPVSYAAPPAQQAAPPVQSAPPPKPTVSHIDPRNYDSPYLHDGFITRKIEPVKLEKPAVAPVISEEVFANAFASPAQPAQPAPIISEILNASPASELFNSEPPVSDSFSPEASVAAEDLSETSAFSGNDHTGYYSEVVESPPADKEISFVDRLKKPKTPRSLRPLNPENQIRMDNYMAAEETPKPPPAPKRKRHSRYNAPPIELLHSSQNVADADAEADMQTRAAILEKTLKDLKLPAKVVAITRGPSVTRYELEMPEGIPVKRIDGLITDIEYYLASDGTIRLEMPIPGKRAVGIEVPNRQIDIVGLKDIIESNEFNKASSPLTLALGKDIAGSNIICELDKMPHLLIAGAPGSGKSSALNSIIMSLIYKSSPEDVRLILVDPKHVEFPVYKGMPHLLTPDIINDAQQALSAFKYLKNEMERRYMLFAKNLARNLPEFNRCAAVKSGEEEKLPHIVLIVDELAELMISQNRKDLEEKIMSLAAKARAAGIHLILATQRPSVDVITGTIKANLPSRIAFSVKSVIDSRTILDSAGAETLMGRGDMLYAPIGVDDPRRVQGAFVTVEEVVTVVEYVKEHNEGIFDDDFKEAITVREEAPAASSAAEEDDDGYDPLMPKVLKIVVETGTASTSFIQRRFSVGYARAARIIDQMEQSGFVGPLDGGKPREVRITWDQYMELFGDKLGQES